MVEIKELVHNYLKDLNPKSVLDLGCGEGKKSIRFLKKGAKVTGVDKKEIKINNINFNFIKEDIKNFKIEEDYDLIIASLILHLFRKEKAIEIIIKIKEKTYKNGFNFLICMSNKDDYSKSNMDNFYPNLEELERLYSDWDIIKRDQINTDLKNHGDLEHSHNLLFLLAKKN